MSYTYPFGNVYETAPVHNSNHEATIIMLHGLGDTGEGWSFTGQQLQIPGVKWLYPTAPTRPISCNMGMAMPGWFDIKDLPLDATRIESAEEVSKEDMDKHIGEEGVKDSVKYCLELVKKEIEVAGIPPEKIIIGGFSQGGHVAARAALECDVKLAGCVVLSSWVGSFFGGNGVNSALPFFVGHGDADPMVPVALGQKSNAFLSKLGHDVTFRTYRGIGHSCSNAWALHPSRPKS